MERWARSHPWAAAYIVSFALIAIGTALAVAGDWADSAVVLISLCSVAIGGFLLDELKNGPARRAPDPEGQASQRAQTE